MPQINDYSVPETQGAEPVGGISPNLEAAGAVGRATEQLGQDVSQVGDLLHRREAARDVSTAYATFANARSSWMQQLQDSATDPNFDVDDFKSKYSDWVSEQSDKINTPEGKAYFDRQAARLGGTLLNTAVKQQAIVAGVQAKQDLQEGINGNAAVLEQDPSQFEDVVQSSVESVDAMVKANPRLAAAKADLVKHLGSQAAMAALRGLMNKDPGSEADGQPGAAQKELESGRFDSFLTPQDRANVEKQISMHQRAADAEKVRAARAQKLVQDQNIEDWQQANVGRLVSGNMTTKEIVNAKDATGAPIPFDTKMQMLNKLEEFNKRKFESDPGVKADTIRRVHLPATDPNAITDANQIWGMVKPGGLGPGDAGQLMGMVSKRPDAKAGTEMRKIMVNSAGSTIRYKDPTGLTQSYAQQGDLKYAQFMSDLMAEEERMRQEKKPVADLYNPASKDYFGRNIEKYKTAPADRLNSLAQDMKANPPPAGPAPTKTVIQNGRKFTLKYNPATKKYEP